MKRQETCSTQRHVADFAYKCRPNFLRLGRTPPAPFTSGCLHRVVVTFVKSDFSRNAHHLLSRLTSTLLVLKSGNGRLFPEALTADKLPSKGKTKPQVFVWCEVAMLNESVDYSCI